MDASLVALKLVLEELDVPCTTETFGDRKRLQKAVYLAQVGAVDFGYRYGWHTNGPYSPALAEDYHRPEFLTPVESGQYALRDVLRQRLIPLRSLLAVPKSLDLLSEDWLELLASVHYLLRVRREEESAARETVKQTKEHVAYYFDDALAALNTASLL
ncbi:MAG: hypothetical protein WBI41_07715 [Azovibrio sp.]|uniref:hypothetical protein n=1 Tax=Azovibrio sp. TaxID=1872673 RepID=UPI003C74E168